MALASLNAEPIEEAAECCNMHQGSHFLRTVQNVASACGCIKACEEETRCTHYSHSVAFGICQLCSGCVLDATRGGGTSARYSSWALTARRDAASVPQLAPHVLCPKLKWPVLPALSVEENQSASRSVNRSVHPLAEWLGQPAQPVPVQPNRAHCVSAASPGGSVLVLVASARTAGTAPLSRATDVLYASSSSVKGMKASAASASSC